MLFLRMLCSIADTPFETFWGLNRAAGSDSDVEFNIILYDIVKFGERHNFEKELGLLV